MANYRNVYLKIFTSSAQSPRREEWLDYIAAEIAIEEAFRFQRGPLLVMYIVYVL